MALGPVTLGGAAGAPVAQRQFGPTLRLRSLANAGPAPALTPGRGPSASRLTVGTTPARLDIDYTATRESMGYYQPLGLLDEIVNYTGKVRQQAIGQIVADGERLARPDRDPHAIAHIAFDTMLRDLRTHEFGIAFLPKVPPKITYVPGGVNLDVVF